MTPAPAAPTYLSADELFVLTGRRQRPAQVAWLRTKRWRHTVTANGDPRVAREYWRRRLVEEDAVEPPADWQPGFLALPPRRKQA